MARTTTTRTRSDGDLGARIRRRRKALGLTAKALARAAEVSPSYISQLEHGKQDRPSLEVLNVLAMALGLSPADLLGVPVPVAVPPEIPSPLATLSEDMGLDVQTTTMLAGIHLDGLQPLTRDGWLLVLLAIRHACMAEAALPATASG